MSRPVIVVQLSDPHIGADWVEGDPVAGLTAAIAQVRRLEPAPDALLVTGDLAEHSADAEYAQVAALLAAVEAPRYVLPGNHDDHAALRRHFDAPGAPGTPIQYAVDLGGLRVLMLDSTRAGADSGQLDADRLAWLENTLAEDTRTPTLLAMHHPPFETGAPAADAIGIPDSDRAALADLVRRHPNVSLIAAGHFHRAIAGRLAGCPVLAAPSTYAGFVLDFTAGRLRSVATPPGYVVHVLRDGEMASHVETLGPWPRPYDPPRSPL
jgi:3',5'-cyclic-AMP phosphodiesterase